MKELIHFSDVVGRLGGVAAMLALASLCSLAHAGASTGGTTYLSACAGCHGASANAPGFAPDLRRFQGDDSAFLDVVKNGRPGTIMSGWQGVLSDADVMSIRSYLKERPAAESREQVRGYASQDENLAAQ